MANKQNKHDRKVRQIAKKLEKDNWNVQADISGYETPESIGNENRIPDIVASKKGAKRIIEVETPRSVKKDKDQQETFRRSAAQQKRTTFTIETTDD